MRRGELLARLFKPSLDEDWSFRVLDWERCLERSRRTRGPAGTQQSCDAAIRGLRRVLATRAAQRAARLPKATAQLSPKKKLLASDGGRGAALQQLSAARAGKPSRSEHN